MGNTRARINSWAAIHEEKWRHAPQKLKEKIHENKKTVKKGIHIPMIMDGGEGNKLKNCCVVENIEHQRKIRENDEIRDNEGDSSPMSKTRSKKGSEEKWGDRSNVSKTIVKEVIEGSLGYCANGPMGVRSSMSKTRLNQFSENKWGYCSNMSKTIKKQGIEGSLGYCANGLMEVISPMSQTRSKQVIEEIWGGLSNVSKKIVKQGIEGSLEYCTNGPI